MTQIFNLRINIALRDVVYNSVPTKILVCRHVPSFGMLNNGKVKNESACAQQKCWFAEKNLLNGNKGV